MQYPYIYAFKRAVLFGKRGSPLYRQYCRVLRRGAKNSVLVEFEDGAWHVVSRNALRKRAQNQIKEQQFYEGKRLHTERLQENRGLHERKRDCCLGMAGGR